LFPTVLNISFMFGHGLRGAIPAPILDNDRHLEGLRILVV